MSEAKRRARQAQTELTLTADAFASLRSDLLEATLCAGDAEEAYRGVLAVQALDRVKDGLHAILDEALIEQAAEKENS